MIEGASISLRHILVNVRAGGKLTFEIVDRATGAHRTVQFDDPAYSVWTEWAPEHDTNIVHYAYESPVTPWSTYALNLATGESTLVQRDPVPGGFVPEDFRGPAGFRNRRRRDASPDHPGIRSLDSARRKRATVP